MSGSKNPLNYTSIQRFTPIADRLLAHIILKIRDVYTLIQQITDDFYIALPFHISLTFVQYF